MLKIPTISLGSIIDPEIMRIRFRQISKSPQYGISLEDTIYVNSAETRDGNAILRVYARGNSIFLSDDLKADCELLGIIIGVEAK